MNRDSGANTSYRGCGDVSAKAVPPPEFYKERVMTTIYYNLAPRYTAGSPAMVTREQMIHTAKQERDAYTDAIIDPRHPDHAKAKERGLEWIAYTESEFRGHMVRTCYLTGKITRQSLDPPRKSINVTPEEKRRALKNAKVLRSAAAVLLHMDQHGLATKVLDEARNLEVGAKEPI